jgi:hypothetical protein
MYRISKGIFTLIAVSSAVQAMEFNHKLLMSSSSLGQLSLSHDGRYFSIRSNHGIDRVERHNLDVNLRSMTTEQLTTALAFGSYVAVKKYRDTDEYSLTLHHRLKGGGPLCATLGYIVGKGGVSFVGHGTIGLIATAAGMVNPALGVAVEGSLETLCGPAIEVASHKAGITLAIAGGVGPLP